MGLATCWVGAFDERAVGEVIDLASHLRPVALIAVGVSERKPPGPGRRPLEEVVDRR
jgi:nitroreductase